MSLSIQTKIQIETAVLRAIQIGVGRAAFADSQQLVPVVTGQLKQSGRYSDTPDGFMIEYTAPYAKKVHDGIKFQTSTDIYTSTVREHERRTATGSTRVRAHKKNYVGMKPQIMSGGNWAVVPIDRARKPNPFLQKALNDRIISLFGQSGALQQYMPSTIRVD